MLHSVSSLLRKLGRRGPGEPSVLTPDEIPRDEVEVFARGPDGTPGPVTVAVTRRRILLTNPAHTQEILSIPLADVASLQSTPTGIRIAYRDAEGAEGELRLGHVTAEEDLVWMGDDSWVQSVAARILEETGRDVWKEAENPSSLVLE